MISAPQPLPRPGSPRPVIVSPCCGARLAGGPVVFWCEACGHDVHGSVINREVPGPAPAAKPVITCSSCGLMSSAGSCSRCAVEAPQTRGGAHLWAIGASRRAFHRDAA